MLVGWGRERVSVTLKYSLTACRRLLIVLHYFSEDQ